MYDDIYGWLQALPPNAGQFKQAVAEVEAEQNTSSPPGGPLSQPPPSWGKPMQPAPQEQPVPPPPEPAPPKPPAMGPLGLGPQSMSAKFGINTKGPMADAAEEAAAGYQPSGYRGNEYGQPTLHTPQQFGQEGSPIGDEGPLSPQDAAAKYDAENPTEEAAKLNVRKHTLGSGARTQENEAYNKRVAADRQAREQERQRLRERGDANMERRERKDAYTANAMQRTNAMQGAGGGMGSQMGGPSAQNIGGAILLGPGFGRPRYDGGRGGNDTPLEWAKHQAMLAEIARRGKKDEDVNELGKGNLGVRKDNTNLRSQQIDNQADQAGAKLGRLTRNDAEGVRKQFDNLVAEYRRRSQAAVESGDKTDWDRGPPMVDSQGNIVPGTVEQRSYRSIMNRIIAMTRALTRAHDEKEYVFEVTPEVEDILMNIKAATDADKRSTPRL